MGWRVGGVAKTCTKKYQLIHTPPPLSALHMPKPKNPPQKVALYTDLMPKELREALLDYLDRLEFPTGAEVEYEVIREEEKAYLNPRFMGREGIKRLGDKGKKELTDYIKAEMDEKRQRLGKRMKRYGPVRAAISKTQRPKRDSKKKRVDFVALEKVDVHKR